MNLQQQMSLFQEGGLEQDGNTIDPVSGNDVPIGSAQEEVRDDIPAQLSEGEFVFPADVVRYLGLEFLMNLRQKAKAGLARMEEMGQMGNSEEATVPDDIPFTVDDLDMEDETQEFQEGGSVEGITQGGFRRVPEIGINPPPQDNIVQDEQATFMNAPAQQPPTNDTGTDFESLLGSSPETYDELRKYVGPNGEISYIAFKDGKPLPAYVSKEQDLLKKGYVYEDPATVGEEELADPTNVGVETAQVRDREGDATDPMNMRRAEQERIKSFKNTIKAVMEENNLSASEAIEFIKAGKHKIKGIPIPGFLFKDFNLVDGVVDASGIARPATYGLDQAAEDIAETMPLFADADDTSKKSTSPFVTTEEDVAKVKTGEGVLSDREQDIKEGTQENIKATQKLVDPKTQELKGKSATAKEIIARSEQQAIKKQQELARKQLEAAQKAKGIREDERKARREQQIELDKSTADKIKDIRTGRRSVLTGFEQGGLATKKPKKKKTVMKRGGLASKK